MSINGEFLPLIFLANLLAWPLAYFAAKQWLQAFTYRIQLEWYYFTLAGIIGLLLSVVVVSYLAAKACLKNPVSVLRGE
jgi:putative ABC transport system permease protein